MTLTMGMKISFGEGDEKVLVEAVVCMTPNILSILNGHFKHWYMLHEAPQ